MLNYLKRSAPFLAIIASLSTSVLAEEDRWYVSVGAGNSFISDIEGDTTISGTKYDLTGEMDSAFAYDIGIGKHFNNWRVEASFGKTNPKMSKLSASTGGTGVTASISPKPEYEVTSYMFNVYRDFSDGNFSPYVGVGIGRANIEMNDYTTNIEGTDVAIVDDGRSLFTWDIKGGLNYEVTDSSTLFTEVAYQQMGEFDEDGINYDAIRAVNLKGGLRFKF